MREAETDAQVNAAERQYDVLATNPRTMSPPAPAPIGQEA